MYPKTFSFIALLACVLMLNVSLLAENPPSRTPFFNEAPSLSFDFENCSAIGGIASADYSEFVPSTVVNPNCSSLSIAANNLFRLNPLINGHSCAPGVNGTTAMCITGSPSCSFSAGDQKALRVIVLVEPGPDGIGSLDNIAFQSMAPQNFQYITGESGLNNYPTKFGVRITNNNEPVYESYDHATTLDWTTKRIDLADVNGLQVEVPTYFQIEILPYCPIGNGATNQAWDIDNLVISGGCNALNGGEISTNQETEFCGNDTGSHDIQFNVTNNKGSAFSWVVLDQMDNILDANTSGYFNFRNYSGNEFYVFHLAHDGSAAGILPGQPIGLVGGCYDLSNSIIVEKYAVDGGNLLTSNQSSSYTVCPNLGNTNLDVSLTGNQGVDVRYILSQNGNIVYVYNSTPVDLSVVGTGDYTLQAISSQASLFGLVAGNTISMIEGCFALSSSINIANLNSIEGGTISSGGQTSVQFCGRATELPVTLSGNVGSSSAYIVTSSDNRIISIQNSSPVDLSSLTENRCTVWHISYENGLVGLVIDGDVSGLNGCFDLSNSIIVDKDEVSGGDLLTVDQSDTYRVCPNLGNTSLAVTLTGNQGTDVRYILSENGNIVYVYNGTPIDLSVVGSGDYSLQAISSVGSLTSLVAGNTISMIEGCYALSTSITVSNLATSLDGGTISSGGLTSLEFCGGETELPVSLSGNVGSNSAYIVTNSANRIISIQNNAPIDFSFLTENSCTVWHLSYEDGLSGLVLDGEVPALDGCYDLSNSISVVKTSVDGGTTSVVGGSDVTALCFKNNDNQAVQVALTGDVGQNSTWLTTDTNGEILSVAQPDNNNSIDFNGVGSGVCLIWHLSYNGSLSGLQVGNSASDLSALCLDLSNPITVNREEVESGVIAGASSYEVCLNGNDTALSLSTDGQIGSFKTWLVTDENGDILETNTDGNFEFSGAPAGVCVIYALSHSDETILYSGAENVNNINLGCFELSEPVTVTRKEVAGGSIALANGATDVTIILGQGSMAMIDVVLTGNTGDDNIYIVTNEIGEILEVQTSSQFDFSNVEVGTCFIQNVSSCGTVSGLAVGSMVSALSGCIDLSNQIRVVREEDMTPIDTLFAGEINVLGVTDIDVCIGDAFMESYDVSFTVDADGPFSSFVVTDDQGSILEITDSNTFTFENAGAGQCRIYHVVFEMDSLATLVAGADINALGAGSEISNAITVNRNVVNGGSIFNTSDSLSRVTFVIGDGIVDTLDFTSINIEGQNSVIIVTDSTGTITDIPMLPLVFDDNVSMATCFVWNLSYADGIEGLEIGTRVPDLVGCYDLSNMLTVTKEPFVLPIDGGVLSSDITEICLLEDSQPTFSVTDFSGLQSDYIIADTLGQIIALLPDANFNSQTLNFGPNNGPIIWDIIHVSSNGMIMGLTVGQSYNDLTGEFDLSNPVRLMSQTADGGQISTTDNETTVDIIVGDSVIDSINTTSSGMVGTSLWLITDTLGVVLELPTGPPFVFEDAGEGVCLIWSLSHAFDFIIAVGDTVANLDGCFALSNPITVNRTQFAAPLSGGTLSADVTEICLGQDSTVVTSLVGANGDNSDFVITDENGIILEVLDSTSFMGQTLNFGAATPSGICNVYHVSYNGMLTGLGANEDISNLAGDFSLSNAIAIERKFVDGGEIMTTDSLTSVSIIVGDGTIDSIDVVLTGAVGDTMQWVILDSDGIILELPASPPFTFEDAGAGSCFVTHVSAAYDFNLSVGSAISNVDCFDQSNLIEVVRTIVMTNLSGGNLMTVDSMLMAEVCLSSGDTMVDVLLSDNEGAVSQYAITDTSGFIIAVPPSAPFNFSGTQAGQCQIWHVSSDVALPGLAVGLDIDTLSGNFALSNLVTVFREEAEGGDLMTTDSTTSVTIMVGDTMPDIISVLLTNTIGDTSWVITDTTGVILELPTTQPFDFTNVDAGVCLIWNLSSAYSIEGLAVGNNVSQLDGCFDLSNSIEVIREVVVVPVVAGTLMTLDSMMTAEYCTNLGMVFSVDLDGNSGDTTSYVVADTLGNILQVSSSPNLMLSTLANSTDVCQIYGVSYSGAITGLVMGGTLSSISGNFAQSNAVTVTKTETNGGTITFPNNNLNPMTITQGDGMVDTVDVVLLNGFIGDTSMYVITSLAGEILDIQADSPLLFPDTGLPDTCIVSHLAYNMGLTGLVVGNNINIALTGCFTSSNNLQVIKEQSLGDSLIVGTVTGLNGVNPIDLCIGDSGGVIDLMVAGANGPIQSWILTDTTGVIQANPNFMPVTVIAANPPVCLVYHIVSDSTLTGLIFNEHIDSLGGNFLLSNAVTINKTEAVATNILFSDSTSVIDIVVGDGMIDSLTVISDGTMMDTSVYVLINSSGVVTAVQDSDLFTFGNQLSGTCTIAEVTYDFGFGGVAVGTSLSSLSGCYAVSNSLTINKTSTLTVDGGSITTATGMNFSICKTDTENDTINVTLTGEMGTNSAWIITDDAGIIVDLPLGPPFVLDTSSLASCQIWHIAFEDPLMGLTVGASASGLMGLFDLSNPVSVTKNAVDGGVISIPNGMSFDTITLGNSPVQTLDVTLTGEMGDSSSWIVTDTLGNILSLSLAPPFNFESFSAGTCQIFNISYSAGMSGLSLANNVNTEIEGCYDLSNPITVVKVNAPIGAANGGILSLASGMSSVNTCSGDAENDSLSVFINGQSGENFSYVVTNKNGVIFSIQDTVQILQDSFIVDIEQMGGDTFKLYHIAYSMPVSGLQFIGNINNLMGTFGLSNSIDLIVTSVNGGTLLPSNPINIVVGEGVIDTVSVDPAVPASGDTTYYVVYDSTGIITELSNSEEFTFENSGGGIFNISAIAALNNTSGVMVGANIADIEGCFELSNPVVVNATLATISGGSLTTSDSLTMVDFCFDSNYTSDSIAVILVDTLGVNFDWVVTDTEGVILDLPSGPPFIIDSMDPDVCNIWSLSSDSTLVGLVIGEDVDTLMSTGDFFFSNPIVVNKNFVNGGTLANPSGVSDFSFCIGDGDPNTVVLSLIDAVGSALQWVIVDSTNSIINIPNPTVSFVDFEGFGAGVCQLYNVSSVDEILGFAVGESLDSLSGCFELSNPLTVTRLGVDGNTISSMPVSIDAQLPDLCVSDGIQDSVSFFTNSTMGNYQFVITDENDIITTVLDSTVFDFEGSGFGVCKIYGVSFTGMFTGAVGDEVGVDDLSSECYDVTQVPLTVNKIDCSMPVLNEVYGDKKVEIKNLSVNTPIDISSFWLCGTNGSYAQISDLDVVCGDVVLAPGGFVVLDLVTNSTGGTIDIDIADDEIGLYSSNNFQSSLAMVDYVQWGSATHLRTTVAVAGNHWTAGDFAVEFASDMSIKFDGSGIMGTDWSEGNPTQCADNLIEDGSTTRRIVDYNLYPNPATEYMNLDVTDLPEEEGELTIFDSFGRVIITMHITRGQSYRLDMTPYGSGVYHSKIVSGRSAKKKRMVLVK